MSPRSAVWLAAPLPLLLAFGQPHGPKPELAPGISPIRAALVAVLRSLRPVEGRLAGGFSHAP
ncbi:MAG TPA: hypothetical protein VGQ28_03485, partial [Thermoanaerobaculia bacterium]|nr:hypothetical protein [Thermoanaerobaculia bacterium]